MYKRRVSNRSGHPNPLTPSWSLLVFLHVKRYLSLVLAFKNALVISCEASLAARWPPATALFIQLTNSMRRPRFDQDWARHIIRSFGSQRRTPKLQLALAARSRSTTRADGRGGRGTRKSVRESKQST